MVFIKGSGKLRLLYCQCMKSQYTAVIERCLKTGLFVGYIPGLAGAHSQGETLEELQGNLKEVLELLFEDAPPIPAAEYVGTQTVPLGS